MNPLPTPDPDKFNSATSPAQSAKLNGASMPANGQVSLAGLNLSGEWIGFYTGHFDQVIKITQIGEEIVAVKITGDDHVPGGAVTFRANIRSGVGEGQVAEREYKNPQFVPGKLVVVNPERIVFTWENCGKVEFRKDD